MSGKGCSSVSLLLKTPVSKQTLWAQCKQSKGEWSQRKTPEKINKCKSTWRQFLCRRMCKHADLMMNWLAVRARTRCEHIHARYRSAYVFTQKNIVSRTHSQAVSQGCTSLFVIPTFVQVLPHACAHIVLNTHFSMFLQNGTKGSETACGVFSSATLVQCLLSPFWCVWLSSKTPELFDWAWHGPALPAVHRQPELSLSVKAVWFSDRLLQACLWDQDGGDMACPCALLSVCHYMFAGSGTDLLNKMAGWVDACHWECVKI